jgi:hypothetical protein
MYLLNKKYIAEELCVNKSKPVLQCQGSCYLEKKIAHTANEEKQGNRPGQKHLLELVYTVEAFFHVTEVICRDIKIENTCYSNFVFSTYINDIFHPPA